MALKPRKVPDELVFGLVQAHNLSVRAFVATTTNPHADITSTQSGSYTAPVLTQLAVAATASSLATSITAAEQIRVILLAHFADAGSSANLYGGAHKAADATNTALISYTTIPQLTSSATLAQVEALLNACKTAVNAHVGQSGVHFTNDGTNSVTAANATDQTTSNTLATGSGGLKAFIVAHLAAASTSVTIQPTSA